jgi:hypothetical protein
VTAANPDGMGRVAVWNNSQPAPAAEVIESA